MVRDSIEGSESGNVDELHGPPAPDPRDPASAAAAEAAAEQADDLAAHASRLATSQARAAAAELKGPRGAAASGLGRRAIMVVGHGLGALVTSVIFLVMTLAKKWLMRPRHSASGHHKPGSQR